MSTEDPLDEKVARHLMELGQRWSRRGLLARLGRVVLWAAGVQLLPLLPTDRSAHAQGGCGDKALCGLCGVLCAACCGGGASFSDCPPCTTEGGAWSRCCDNDCTSPPRRIRYYRDCCGTVPGYTDSEAASCAGTACANNCPQPAWCSGLGAYRCTVVGLGPPC